MSALAVWLLPMVAPFTAGGIALLHRRGWPWLLPAAPVPALLLAAAGPPEPPELAWILLDAELMLDPLGRVLLGMTALLWMIAGWYARPLARERLGVVSVWLFAVTGNIGLYLAGDVVSFLTLFALMTYAAYGLVVHDRTGRAQHAGRVYIAFAVLGEALLLVGALLAVAEAQSLALTSLAEATATADHRGLIIGFITAGFAIKAGVIPLHGWLPLAHPAAPVAASAVLSGAMIKAGLLGWLRLLPLGEAGLPSWSALLVAVGLVSAVGGVALGLLQRDPKVVLAYSSVSQMGLLAVLVGVGLGTPAAAPGAVATAAAYALHHGFAKGALFLAVGMARRARGPWRSREVRVGLALTALSLAGLPPTGGWVAKQWLKDAAAAGAGAGALAVALPLAAVATTMLMGHLLVLTSNPTSMRGTEAGRLLPWAGAVVAALLAPWFVSAALPALPSPQLTLAGVWDGAWPVLVGAAGAAALLPWSRPRRAAPPALLPPGDIVVPAQRAARLLVARALAHSATAARHAGDARRAAHGVAIAIAGPGGSVERVDERLRRWSTVGALFALLLLALRAVLGVV